ncbi:MAG TPA: excinuclease ABC subunit UvrC, partial [Polyangia bacterium]|nr:excinuclease ABC subunit UvrC [Polyangia bacterium]
MSEGDESDLPRPSLREGEVAPARKTLAQILEGLPAAPGVYIMKDGRGKPIYIGKAAILRNRVRQYFQPASGDTRDFVPLLDGIVADIETVVTSNEKEALLLENTLIKRHQPRFNVKLTDDKNFLVLRLDPAGEWPRLEVVRRIGHDGAYYFGPYHSATSCRETLRVVNRHFQLRTCTDHVLHNRRRPCLQYQIKRCPGPCVLPVSRDAYGEQIRDVRLFLDGKSDELLDRLRGRMKDAAGRQEFEIAAEIRDQIRALEVTLEKQRVVSTDFVDQDVIGFYRQGIALEIAVLSIRNGQLNGSRQFSFTNQEFPDAELISSFVGLYYDMSAPPPDEVLLPVEIDDAAVKADWLSDKRAELGGRRRKVDVSTPQRGDRRRLVELANKNAAASFATRRNARADVELALGKLARRLKLPKLPRVIECYDVSHLQGFATVASMVVFVDGRPDKARYR